MSEKEGWEKDKTSAIKVWYIEADGLYIFQTQNSWHFTAPPRLKKLIQCTIFTIVSDMRYCMFNKKLFILLRTTYGPSTFTHTLNFWHGPSQNLAFPSAAVDQNDLLHGKGPAITNTTWRWPSNIPAIIWQLTNKHQEVGTASQAFTLQPSDL